MFTQFQELSITLRMYPPPSGRHAMRCLYGIGRDSWVWDMSRHALARCIPPTEWEYIPFPQCGPLLVYIRGDPRVRIIVAVVGVLLLVLLLEVVTVVIAVVDLLMVLNVVVGGFEGERLQAG